MKFAGRISESAAATRTFATLRIDRRVLMTPGRTIAIANISTLSVGAHIKPKPKVLYWLLALLFAAMTWGSMRPDFSLGPVAPTGASVVLGMVMAIFVALALRPDDKTEYLLISSSDGVLSRFAAPDRGFLDEVRSILTDKINRGDEQMAFNIDFEKCHIENLANAGGGYPPPYANGLGRGAIPSNGSALAAERAYPSQAGPNARNGAHEIPAPTVKPRRLASIAHAPNGGNGAAADAFVDYAAVLPAIVEMHRFYARQPGTQHLEQRLSELEMLMRAGSPTLSQKTRVRELAGDMSQILQAYPQAVELFQHIGSLV